VAKQPIQSGRKYKIRSAEEIDAIITKLSPENRTDAVSDWECYRKEMIKFCGQITTVEDVFNDGDVNITIDRPHWWHLDWLEE